MNTDSVLKVDSRDTNREALLTIMHPSGAQEEPIKIDGKKYQTIVSALRQLIQHYDEAIYDLKNRAGGISLRAPAIAKIEEQKAEVIEALVTFDI